MAFTNQKNFCHMTIVIILKKGWQHGMRRKGLIGWCLGVWGCPMAITHISHTPSQPLPTFYTRCHKKSHHKVCKTCSVSGCNYRTSFCQAGIHQTTIYWQVSSLTPSPPLGAYHCIDHHNYHQNGYCLHQFCVSVVDNFVLSFWCIPTSKEQKARHHSENYCFSPKLYSIFVRDPQSLQSKFTKVYLMR